MGRRHHRMLWKLMLVVCAVLAILSWGHSRADAATPDPAVHCASAVRWELDATLVGTPQDASAAIRAAWAQVAPVARLTPTEVDQSADVAWRWPDTGMMQDFPDQQAWDTTLFGGHRYWAISHSAATSDAAGKALQRLVLHDVLQAMGVAHPTSGATLSAHDRQALKAVCRAEAATASPSPSTTTSPPVTAMAPAAPEATQPSSEVSDSPITYATAWTGGRGVAHHVAVLAAGILAVLLTAWWTVGPKLARAVTAIRNRDDHAGGEDLSDSDDLDDQGNRLPRTLNHLRRAMRRGRNTPTEKGELK